MMAPSDPGSDLAEGARFGASQLAGLPLMIGNEVRLHYYELKQYWFETIASIVLINVVFLGLFKGIQLLVPSGGPSLSELVFGYIVWVVAATAFGQATSAIVETAQRGYLEQLFLSPSSFLVIMIARAIAGLLFVGMHLVTAAYVCMFLTNNWISINLLKLYGLMLIGIPAITGIGFMVSGVALIDKKIDSFHTATIFALMALVAADGLPPSLTSLLPFTPCVSIARMAVLSGLEPAATDYLVVGANALAYFALGCYALRKCESIAKKGNLIGNY